MNALRFTDTLNPDNLGFINNISEDTYDYIFCLCVIHKYKEAKYLSINFIYVNFISYNHRRSSLMIHFASKCVNCVNLEVGQQGFETS